MSLLFAPGDVVRLKSGGFRMTVSDVTASDVTCVWVEGGRQTADRFSPSVLVLAPPPKPVQTANRTASWGRARRGQ
jgi:uncharacterized protein YodC (DUF2158 family)